MRRDSSNQRDIVHFLLFALLIVYESLTTIHTLLPPLFGLVVAFFVIGQHKEYTIWVVIYLLLYEADHNLFIFSTLIYLYIFQRFIYPFLEDNLASKKLIIAISAAMTYPLFWAVIVIVNFLFGNNQINIDYSILIWHIIAETILALLII